MNLHARLTALLTVSSVFLMYAPTSHAQILAADDEGYAISVIPVTLASGVTYNFRSDYVLGGLTPSGGDTVMTLSDASLTTSYAGADGCVTPSGFSWLPSCFVYTPSFTGTYFVITRAWRLRNDWFENDQDYDNDSLSHTLEQALGTCDRPSDVMPNAQSCEFAFCDSNPSGDVCQAQLRDTDHDGLRDDIEVYGHTDVGTMMALYGADPTHVDLFVEVDFEDRVPLTTTVCDGYDFSGTPSDIRLMGSGSSVITHNFFDRVADIYSQAPSFVNPDGTTGVRVHYDVGVQNPNRNSDAWGDWGGGGTCFLGSPGHVVGNTAPGGFSPQRRWLFRWANDGLGSGGKAFDIANVDFNVFGATDTASHVHELGHTLGLSHEGPWGSAAESNHFGGNYRPLWPSRMNDRFDAYASLNGSSVPGGAQWDGVSFSSGAWNREINARETTEIAPGPAGEDLGPLEFGFPAEMLASNHEDVDWDRDGGTPSGTTHQAQYREMNDGRQARRDLRHLDGRGLGTHSDAAAANGVLVHAYASYEQQGIPRIFLRADGDGECDLIPSAPAGGVPEYGPCVEFGAPYDTGIGGTAISVSPEFLPFGQVEGMVVVIRDGTDLRTYELDVDPNPTSLYDASIKLGSGTLQFGWPDAAGDPVLVRTIGGGTLLLYEATDGLLYQAHLFSGGSPAGDWAGPVASQLASGAAFGSPGTTPGLVAYDGEIYMVALDANQFRVYRWASTGSHKTRRWTALSVIPSTSGSRLPELVASPAPTGSVDPELHLWYRNSIDKIRYARTDDLVTWVFQEEWVANERGHHPTATTYDARPGITPGLRMFRDVYAACTDTPDCTNGASWPGGQLDATCDTSTGRCVVPGPPGQPATLMSKVVFTPLSTGLNPTEYCDYDEWVGMSWGACELLNLSDTPAAGSYGAPYDSLRCRNRPIYGEADFSGTCQELSVLSSPPENDRALHPEAYAPPDEETQCVD